MASVPDDTALEYLSRTSAEMANGYVANCVTHACAIADLLLRSKRSPWIARLRRITQTDAGEFHWPLNPRRFTGPHAVTWNTHYVCCLDDTVYDPIAGTPLPLDRYCQEVFGIDGPLVEHLSSDETAALWREGTLKGAFPPRRA